MAEPTATEETQDEVAVQVSDLETIRGALSNLYYLSVSLDLQDQYRRLETRGSTSALTSQGEEALTKVNSYLELARDDDTPSAA